MHLPGALGIYSKLRAALPFAPAAGDPLSLATAGASSSRATATPRTDLVTMYGIEGLLAGRTLVDRYLVEEVIGRGGMGAVYRAKDLRLDREVALKVVSMAAPDAAAHARLRARFNREARAAAAIHHPNVVAVHDFGTDPALGIDFLVMELLRGEDLAARLNGKGAPAIRTALEILYQAARGLAAGHRAGLIHRDVKPGNLFLEPGDRVGEVQVKVLDFGIAEVGAGDDQTMTHLTEVLGRSPFSPAYASPEQMLGERRLLPATDVFSLGAVGFHLLTGRRVFTSSNPAQAAAEVAEGISDLEAQIPRVPVEVREALRRSLSLRPDERFRDAGALADAVEAVLSERGTTAAERAWTGGGREPEPPPRYTRMEEGRGLAAQSFGASVSAPQLAAQAGALSARDALRMERLQTRLPARAPVGRVGEEARQGWFHRAVTAVWNFCVTSIAVGLFAGSWVLVVQEGLGSGDETALYGGVAASTVLAPLAVHRILGRRGSYGVALIASLGVTIAGYNFLGAEWQWDAPGLLAGVCGLQLLSAVLVERLTSRSSPSLRSLPDPQHTPRPA